MRHVAVILGVAGILGGCGSDPTGSEVPDLPDPNHEDPIDDPDDDIVPEDGVARNETFAVRVFLRNTLSLGGRGVGVLCPDEQEIEVGVTTLVRRTVEGGRVLDKSTLCSLDLPTFTVSANGALGGCDETREAELALGFDLGALEIESSLEVAETDAGDALPMAFLLGAALDDPFADAMPTWDTPELLRDDDGDGQPGVTFLSQGLPVLDDGAQLYGAMRVLVTPTDDGHADAGFSLSLVGSNAGISGRTLEVVSPRFDGGIEVEIERTTLDDAATCASLIEVDQPDPVE